MMKRIILAIGALFIASFTFAQSDINYTISFPNAAHHEAEISMQIGNLSGKVLRVRMSRSSAGRYATHEFGKNIYNVKAFNREGKPLAIKQVEGDIYEIAAGNNAVKITYTLFANWTDGTYASVNPSHAHLNMPAVFMWAEGLDNRAIDVVFNEMAKYGWKIATQLKPEGHNSYYARNLQYLMDSPTELSAYKESSWKVTNPDGKQQDIRLTIHSDDAQSVIDNFAGMVHKVTLEEAAVFGEFPAYDYGTYTFLDDVYPTNSGDGMEHRNSTCIVQTDDQVAGNELDLLSTYSHEYFHSWNVKRIRPKSLEPFNFAHANMSSELWFAEGFTEYYGEMLLVRAGFHTPQEYTGIIATLVNQVLNTPGASKYPATQMSRYSVFADAGVSIDPNNNTNIFTSYYYYGGAIALALDLRLRTEYHLTLDDYMRAVWLALGKVMKPYTIPDLQRVLADVTKNPHFAADFFSKYIYGTDKNNYAQLLARAGFLLRKAQPGRAWLGPIRGANSRNRAGQAGTAGGNGVPVIYNTTQGTPVYKSGIDSGDMLLTADGRELNSLADLQAIVNTKKPGEKLVITYRNRAGEHQTTITLEEDPTLEVVTYEAAGMPLSQEQLAFRKAWLSSKVK
jgi:predicted metalloprotease with PDZ domain